MHKTENRNSFPQQGIYKNRQRMLRILLYAVIQATVVILGAFLSTFAMIATLGKPMGLWNTPPNLLLHPAFPVLLSVPAAIFLLWELQNSGKILKVLTIGLALLAICAFLLNAWWAGLPGVILCMGLLLRGTDYRSRFCTICSRVFS